MSAQPPAWSRSRLFGGQIVSILADTVTLTAVPLVVLDAGGSGLVVGLIGAIQTLPNLLLGLHSGAAADRMSRRLLMVWADLGRCASLLAVAGAALLGWPLLVPIVIAVAIAFSLRSLWLSGWTAAVPSIVARGRLGRVYANFEALYALGPAIAGLLVATFGALGALSTAAVAFGFGGVLVLSAGHPLLPEARERRPVLADIRDGLTFVLGHRALLLAILYSSSISVITVGLSAIIAYDLTVGRPEAREWLPAALAAFSFGTLAGSVAAPRIGGIGPGLLMLGGGWLVVVAALAAAAVAASGAGAIGYYLVAVFAIGAGWELVLVPYLTVRALAAPLELQGRVGAVARIASLGFQPLGMLATGFALEFGGAGIAYAGIAVSAALLTIGFGASRAFRGMRTDPVVADVMAEGADARA